MAAFSVFELLILLVAFLKFIFFLRVINCQVTIFYFLLILTLNYFYFAYPSYTYLLNLNSVFLFDFINFCLFPPKFLLLFLVHLLYFLFNSIKIKNHLNSI